jgi:hypothetical protein
MKRFNSDRELIDQCIAALPKKKSKYLNREAIVQRIEAVAALNLPKYSKNALRR